MGGKRASRYSQAEFGFGDLGESTAPPEGSGAGKPPEAALAAEPLRAPRPRQEPGPETTPVTDPSEARAILAELKSEVQALLALLEPKERKDRKDVGT